MTAKRSIRRIISLKTLLLIGSGGFFGAIFRYATYQATRHFFISHLPMATLIVNVLGCLLAGYLFESFRDQNWSPHLMKFLSVGFLGSFTTFSAFSLETTQLIKSDQWAWALFNVILNIFLGFSAVVIGIKISQA